jgi:hypothetical protein
MPNSLLALKTALKHLDEAGRDQAQSFRRQEFLDEAIAANQQITLATRLGVHPGKGIELLGQPWFPSQTSRRALGNRTLKTTCVFTMDPFLEEVRHKLIEAQFSLQPLQAPDAKNFGNWILIGARDHLAIRVTNDRGDILLDVMPSHLFAIGPNESDWFNYDAVARGLGIYLRPKEDVIRSFLHHFWMIDAKFSPHKWDKTATILTGVDHGKRRSFVEGR